MKRTQTLSMMMKATIATAVILLTSSSLLAQTMSNNPVVISRSTFLGLYGAFQFTQHSASIAGLPGVPTCSPGFNDGSGTGFAFGALYQMPLATRLALQLRAGYSILGGALTTDENIGNAVSNGEVVNAMVEHRIEPTFGVLGIEPMVSWYPLSFPLSINLGVQAGALLGKSFKQSETLISPTTATFTTGLATRNTAEGDIAETNSPFIAAIAGLSYDIPVSKKIMVTPELAYHYNLTDVVKDSSWKIHALRLGVSVKMLLSSPTSSPTEKPNLMAAVRASGLFPDSSEQPIVQVRVEEFLGASLRPLLPYVFFDENSRRLPDRYVHLSSDEARAFSVDNLHYLNAIDTYHQILNIIGRRMQENPSATISLVGCNSDEGDEKGNTALSLDRAERVRDYLHDVWNIAENRMKVTSRDLPEKPSNVNEPDGVVENRRVEIYSDNWKIMEPVLTNDTIRTATPPGIRFRTSVQSDVEIATWRLTAGQNGRTLKEFSGTGPVPPMLDWNLEADQSRVPSIPIPIDYQLEVTDEMDNHFAAPAATIPTDQVTIQKKRRERIADKEINRYSLILFDFGKSDISDANRRIIDFIKNRITLDAKTTITGYTDRVGDPAFNKKLSQDRAMATAQALGVPASNASGAGETMLYDNDLPEGRFYCRTVKVVVETPVVE